MRFIIKEIPHGTNTFLCMKFTYNLHGQSTKSFRFCKFKQTITNYLRFETTSLYFLIPAGELNNPYICTIEVNKLE